MSATQMKQQIQMFQNKQCGIGATDNEISRAQDDLGITFPESYRCFLHDFGWAQFANEEIYGLGKDVPIHLDLVRNTISERHEMHPLLPHALIPIMNDGAGNNYCLDLSNNAEGPIVFWNHELSIDQKPEIVCPTFAQWLVGLLQELKR